MFLVSSFRALFPLSARGSRRRNKRRKRRRRRRKRAGREEEEEEKEKGEFSLAKFSRDAFNT